MPATIDEFLDAQPGTQSADNFLDAGSGQPASIDEFLGPEPPPERKKPGAIDLFNYHVADKTNLALQGLFRGMAAITNNDENRKDAENVATGLEKYRTEKLLPSFSVQSEDLKSTTSKVVGAAANVFDIAPGPAVMIAKLAGETYGSTYNDTVQRELGGRQIVQNPDGSVSTERTATVGLDGKYYNVPTLFDGKQVSPDEAAARISAAGMKDPETGRDLIGYDTVDAAVEAAKARSADLGNRVEAIKNKAREEARNSVVEMAPVLDKAGEDIGAAMRLANLMRESAGRQRLYKSAADEAKMLVDLWNKQEKSLSQGR